MLNWYYLLMDIQKDIKEKINNILKEVDLYASAELKFPNYQVVKKRVAIARHWLRKLRLLLLMNQPVI